MSAIAIAFLIPNLFFTKTIWITETASYASDNNKSKNFEALIDHSKQLETNLINLFSIDFLCYSITFISLFLALSTLFKIIRLSITISGNVNTNGSNIKISNNSKTVFSFYKWIVISPDILVSKNADLILQHEQIHIKQKHSIDLIAIELLSKLFWFNPFVKLLQKDMVLNLEFEVDSLLITPENAIRYQLCLLETQLHRQAAILSTFNSSDLKKRIVHINNQKSKPMKKLKFLFGIPVLVLFFSMFQVETIAQTLPKSMPTKSNMPIVSTAKPIYILNTKQITEKKFKKINTEAIKSINVLKDKMATDKYGEKGKNGVIEISTKEVNKATIIQEDSKTVLLNNKNKGAITIKPEKNVEQKSIDSTNTNSIKLINKSSINKVHEIVKPLYVVDHVIAIDFDITSIDVNTIKSISILKAEKAIEKYGDKGKNGVVEIITKQNIEETATKNKKQIELNRQKIFKEKRQAELDKQQTLKNKKEKVELDRQKSFIEKNKKEEPNASYITSVTSTNTIKNSFAYFPEPNKNIKVVYVLDGKHIEKKNVNYDKVDYIKTVQDEEAKKLANDQTVDVAVILAKKN